MEERKKNFVDFIFEAQKNKELTQGFLEADNAKKLMDFFNSTGFIGITYEECEKLEVARANLPPILLEAMY